ncbi:MAG TPA: amino acid racemase [Polyangiales bacterium]
MTQHIGIVGCSAEGAALCYRTICLEGALLLGPHGHPEVTLHTHSLAEYVERIERDDWHAVGALLLSSARKLAHAGANFLICPDNTVHQALPLVRPHSPLPWLHIADVVAAAAVASGYTRLGLMGTRWLLDSEVYPERLAAHGLACARPGEDEGRELTRIIMEELVRGGTEASSVRYVERVIHGLRAAGCDAVVLGCTELPLIVSDANSALPTLDSTRLLARAALERASEPRGVQC